MAGCCQLQSVPFVHNFGEMCGTCLSNGMACQRRTQTWEPLQHLCDVYPDFQLVNELFAQAGRYVMTGIPYARRRLNSG